MLTAKENTFSNFKRTLPRSNETRQPAERTETPDELIRIASRYKTDLHGPPLEDKWPALYVAFVVVPLNVILWAIVLRVLKFYFGFDLAVWLHQL